MIMKLKFFFTLCVLIPVISLASEPNLIKNAQDGFLGVTGNFINVGIVTLE